MRSIEQKGNMRYGENSWIRYLSKGMGIVSMVELDEKRISHLGFIQGVVNRMAANSFSLKALAVTISAAIIALASTQTNLQNAFPFVGLLPVVIFWIMDAKYLRLERLYRTLYDSVRTGEEVESFSMDTSPFESDVSSTFRIAFSWSIIWFYFVVAAALIAVSCLPSQG